MDKKIKLGDEVVLKSGSILMTVTSNGSDGENEYCICTYYKNREFVEREFPTASLRHAHEGDYMSSRY